MGCQLFIAVIQSNVKKQNKNMDRIMLAHRREDFGIVFWLDCSISPRQVTNCHGKP